jgi:hypothetical protein
LLFSTQAAIDVKLLRKLLSESPKNEKTAELFFEQTKNFNKANGALLLGFKAMSEFMLCNHVSNVFSKLNHFNTGKKLLEEVIKKESKNAELIYFRFTVQTNAPALLAYSARIKEDKQFLINYIKDNFSNANKDVDLYNRIRIYLLQCNACSQAEKENIKNL